MAPQITDTTKFKIDDETLLAWVQADIDAAEKYFESTIMPKLIERYQLANADKGAYDGKFPRLSARSRFVSRDIQNCIDWIMPSIIEIFFGSQKIVSLSGRTVDDNPKPMEQLIQWQLTNRNPGFMIFHQWFKDVFKAGLGNLKAWWVKDWKTERQEIVIPASAFADMEDTDEIKDAEDLGDGTVRIVRDVKRTTRNDPTMKNLMPGEWVFSPTKDDQGRHLFECERRYVTRDALARKIRDGVYKDIDLQNISSGERCGSLDEMEMIVKQAEEVGEWSAVLGNATTDEARDLILLRECYGFYDVNQDGLLEFVLVTVVANQIVRREICVYERAPYFDLAAIPADYQRWAHAFADTIGELQDLKTALMRQVIINVAINNERRMAIDNNQQEAIRAYNGGAAVIPMKLEGQRTVADVVQFMPHAPLAPETLPVIEMIQGWIEQGSGTGRYNQGLDASSLNKTAEGISRIMQASQQRIRLMARIMAETGVRDLFKFMVEMNQRWMDQETVIRLIGEPITIHPDDLQGSFDVEVAAGVGVTDSMKATQDMMVLIQQLFPSFMQLGLVGPENFYAAGRRLIEEMGYKNVGEFLRDPNGQAKLMQGVPGPLPGGMPGQIPMMGAPAK